MAVSASELRNRQFNLLTRKIPKPPYRHAAPAGWVLQVPRMVLEWLFDTLPRPWPYVDSIENDQEIEEVIDAKIPARIGSCGHDNCEVCPQWIAYPQSHFGNWTIKPVTKCGIAWVVRNNEWPSTIYVVDVLEDGEFINGTTSRITSENKRQFWNTVLQSEASCLFKTHIIPYDLTRPSARVRDTRTCAIRGQHVRSCSANAGG